ncbi:MAG: hypothetical protein K9L21_04675 [Spirochaetia bacterium]|nr:hypothetical protein [Spirochaetia bacterium]
MNPRNRILAALNHKNHDRIPLDVFGFNGYRTPMALGLKGFNLYAEPYACPQDPARRRIEERLSDISAVQHPVSAGVNRFLVTPSQRIKETILHQDETRIVYKQIIDTPKGTLSAVLERRADSVDNIWTIEYPVKNPDDLEKLASIPFELPENIETLDEETFASIAVDNRSITYSYMSSPFVCVGGSMPYEEFLYLCAVDLPAVEEYTAICGERINQITDYVLAGGFIDMVWIGGSEWLTPPMSSPEIYRKLSVEPEKKLIERIHSHHSLAHIHSHGNVGSPIIDSVIERGADYFEPVEPPPDGNIEFADAKEQAGKNLTLGGNIELSLIESGSPEKVYRAVEKAVSGRKDNMVLAISAPTNRPAIPAAMEKNLHALIDAWEELGDL